MNYGLLDFIGNIGVAILMVAYLLLQLNRLSGSGIVYSMLNAFGACLIVISLFANFNLSAFLIEVFWILISFIGIYRHFRSQILNG